MNLGNLKTAHKVLAVIALLGCVSLAITGASVLSLKWLSDAAMELDVQGKDEVLGGHMHEDVLALNRAEFRVAAQPTGENLKASKKVIAEKKQEIEKALAEAKAGASKEQAGLLAEFEQSYKLYLADLRKTIAEADRVSAQVSISDAQQQVVNAAMTSRAAASKLEKAAEAYVELNEKEADRLAEEAVATYETVSITMVVGALIGIAVGLALGLVISQKGIVTPIRKIVDCLRALADGKLDTEVFGNDRRDEVGEIAATTQVFKENLIAAEKMRARQEEERKAKEERQVVVNNAVAKFEKAMADIVKTVASASTELQSSAQSMAATAEETAKQATTVAAAAEEAAANVQTVASATEELAASVKEIGQQVDQSKTATGNAVTEVEDTATKVKTLSEASDKIGDVVRLINDIASQTNLLALNATIEAARAGEAGKGFAVVASEVKNLASQTAKATEEIASQVTGIQEATASSVGAIDRIGGAIKTVSEIANAIAAAVEEQGAATQEIARNVSEASTGTSEVTRNVSGVSQAAGDTGTAAAQVLDAANELSKQSETLRSEFDEFVAVVRAA